jgi:glycerate kinase
VKILVAPDKFKGSLTAAEVADSVATGLEQVPGIRCDKLPLADGGDGSVAAAVAAGYRLVPIDTVGPTGEPVHAAVAFDGYTAVVEVANTCGLSLLPDRRLEPLTSSSYGFGQAITAALALRPTTVVLALGGSASTDAGMGMLTALGAVFTDRHGRQLTGNGDQLGSVAAADLRRLGPLQDLEWVVASDVEASLHGGAGAAQVFGPQKGASPTTVHQLDQGLRHFADLLGPWAEKLAGQPGAGAAGGLGFAGLVLGGRIVSGAHHFLDLLHFNDHVADADVVITGEGRIDDQTLQGKLPFVVAQRSAPRPVHVVVGRNDLAATTESAFAAIHQLSDYTTADTRSDPESSASVLSTIGRAIAIDLAGQPVVGKPPIP